MSRPPGVAAAAQVMLRPIANPLPLGFLALAAGTLLVAGLQLGFLATSEGRKVALILIAFVFPLQLLCSVFGFLARDIVAATAMGLLSGIWLSIALVRLDSPPGAASDALGVFLLLAGAAMCVPALAAAGHKWVPAGLLAMVALRFVLTGIAELAAGDEWSDVAGVVGLALCAVAFYAALALALEDARKTTVLPLGRRGRFSADQDPGVREEL